MKDTHTHTHTHSLHTRTQQLRVVPDEQILGGGGRGFEGKALYFCGGGVGGDDEAVFCCCCFFQSSGQLAFVKMYNFLQVMVLRKNTVCSNGICWNEKKKFLFLEEGSPEKKNELCECHGGGVD